MPFQETLRFPDRIARNAARTRMTKTQEIVLANGYRVTNRIWSQRLRTWDVGIAIRTEGDYAEMMNLIEALDGPADGFRLRDPSDFLVVAANGVLRPLQGTVQVGSPGLGFGTPSYQLQKLYTAGPKTSYRDIRKPRSVATVRRNGLAVTFGAAPGNVAADTTQGLITFVADQTRTASGHTPGASHVVTLASAFSPNMAVGGRLWLTGVTGTAAALLNSAPLQVTAVAGNVITVAVNTAGLTATGGTAFFYPQPTETLDWAGQFDVPVCFDGDEIEDAIVQRNSNGLLLLRADSIRLREIRV